MEEAILKLQVSRGEQPLVLSFLLVHLGHSLQLTLFFKSFIKIIF